MRLARASAPDGALQRGEPLQCGSRSGGTADRRSWGRGAGAGAVNGRRPPPPRGVTSSSGFDVRPGDRRDAGEARQPACRSRGSAATVSAWSSQRVSQRDARVRRRRAPPPPAPPGAASRAQASTDAPARAATATAARTWNGRPCRCASRRTYAASAAESARRPWSTCTTVEPVARTGGAAARAPPTGRRNPGRPRRPPGRCCRGSEHLVGARRGDEPAPARGRPPAGRRTGATPRGGRASVAGSAISSTEGRCSARAPHQVERVHVARARRSRARTARRSRTA